MEARKDNEALSIRVDNAATATTSAPTSATAGIAPIRNKNQRERCHLEIQMSADDAMTIHIKVHGYRSRLHSQSTDGKETLSEVDSSGFWSEIYNTTLQSGATDFNKSFLLRGATDYERLETEIVAISGTNGTVTTSLAFAGRER